MTVVRTDTREIVVYDKLNIVSLEHVTEDVLMLVLSGKNFEICLDEKEAIFLKNTFSK